MKKTEVKYKISSEKQKLFDNLLDLLTEIDRVCVEHNIQYFLAYGTLLGAIRHKGFIPWDDDIDIQMLRPDYERLKQLGESGIFKNPYFFQNPNTDPGYPKGFCRLRNSDTVEISQIDAGLKCNHGCFYRYISCR